MSRTFKVRCDGCGREEATDPTKNLPGTRLDDIPWSQVKIYEPNSIGALPDAPSLVADLCPRCHPTKPQKVTR